MYKLIKRKELFMKICLELQPYLKTKSGIGVYAYEISKHLEQINRDSIELQIFNFRSKVKMKMELLGLEANKDECRVMPYGVYRRIWHYLPISYNYLFKQQGDIYQFFDYIVPPRVKGKVVTTIHDMTYELYPETMQKATLERIKKDINYSVERADKVITISESTKRDMISILKIPEQKIEIISPGVDFEKFNKPYTPLQMQYVRERYQLPENYILYMGTLEPRKNIESIIEAFALMKKESDSRVQEVKLVLAGKKGWLYESIFNKVRQLGIESEVVFTDFIEEEHKPILYQLAKAFVFPSIYEGFGIPVLEAMAASVPVITSNVSSLPEVAGDAALLVSPKDKEKIAESMYTLITDEDSREQLRVRGLKQAQKFSWKASAEKLYDIYEKLV